MTAPRWSVSFLLAGALLVGCDDKKPDAPKVDNKPAAPKVEGPKTPDAAKTDMAKSATDAAKTAVGDVAKTANPAKLTLDPAKVPPLDASKVDPSKLTESVKVTPPDVNKTTTPDAPKSATGGAAADAAKAQAGEWMTKLEDAIKNNKLDDAKGYFDKLQAVKSSLSPEWQAKLDTLKTAYEAAKLKGGLPNLTK